MECKNCSKEVTGKGNYCSASCKTLYNRKRNKSVTVTPETVTSQSVTSQSVTSQSVTPETVTAKLPVEHTIKDCNGTEHPIDFKGRQADAALLKSWAEGKGNTDQRSLGALAMQYSIINGFKTEAGKLTLQGRTYMGHRRTIGVC